MQRFLKLISSWIRMIKLRKLKIVISPLAFVSEDCQFEGPNYIDRFCVIQTSNWGKFSYVGNGSQIFRTKIGRYCSISSGVKIGLGIHPSDYLSTSPIFYSEKNIFGPKYVITQMKTSEHLDVVIGHDVWIGANAVIMGGVKIGNGSIIAAGAVVTKDVPSFTIVGGVPSKVIRPRFPAEVAAAIESTGWWDLEESELKSIESFFNDPSILLLKN